MPQTNAVDKRRIAKNTLFLYLRMILVMAVSLFTSRIILQALGVDDYGTYQVVGSVVSILAFLNGTLSAGTSRFLLFEMGYGDKERLRQTFSTMLTAHITLALTVVILAETIGLWFVYHKLVIAPERMDAAVFTYHLSIVTGFFSITQAPYAASIKSHERMDIYAYTSIVDVLSKLAITYLLFVSPIDRLEFYALLLCIEQVVMSVYYRAFCSRRFEECRYKFSFNKKMFSNIIGYSGWSLLSHVAGALNGQGIVIIMNMFFAPGVVTAMGVANTVKNAANAFVENYWTATVPQIVKQYAAGEKETSRELLLDSTKYAYFLLLLMALPIFLLAPDILQLWLGMIPDYSDVFLRYIIILCVVTLFNMCMYTAIDAAGKIKQYSIVYPSIMILCFPVVYLLFRMGMPPYIATAVMLVASVIVSFVLMPYLVINIGGFQLKDILLMYWKCISVTLPSLPIPLIVFLLTMHSNIILRTFAVILTSMFSVGMCVWLIGVDGETKKKLIYIVRQRINHGISQESI